MIFRAVTANALTRNFSQTDWLGGADTNTTADETNLSDWDKYYSKEDSVDVSTPGEIKLILP